MCERFTSRTFTLNGNFKNFGRLSNTFIGILDVAVATFQFYWGFRDHERWWCWLLLDALALLLFLLKLDLVFGAFLFHVALIVGIPLENFLLDFGLFGLLLLIVCTAL